ncbi:M3 family metallopeptidase [Arthrobacter roseus]|uniref:M3 family metallopeptidase n=1 Tax=Arthrobacter roseus TaxID=136274 RepID=UPI001963DC9C|nr:M3 family metallopeptidase [Arthrobacter roseus]MBM7848670.1 peptidyl-dipeptidase Dcp [Arthrobacter roseus]
MSNPFLSPSPLPYGLPPFEAITEDHYAEAFDAGLAEKAAETKRIAESTEPATFRNTVVALETSGAILDRVSAVFFTFAAAHSTPGIQALQSDIASRLSELDDDIHLNAPLYARIKDAVSTVPDDAESQRLFSEYLDAFTRSGANLDDDGQTRLRQINGQLSTLSTHYQQRLLSDTNAAALVVESEEELDGLTPDSIASAAAAASDAGHDGKFLLPLVLPTSQPALPQLHNRNTRRRLHTASVSRGASASAESILAIGAEIAELRAERASLFGCKSHAEYATDNQTAPSLEAIHAMTDALALAAVRNAEYEASELSSAAGHDLEPWDWSYYSEQVRVDKYDVDLAALRPYFELERVIHDGIFHAANLLYGVTFQERTDLVGYHPGVRVWEVFNADGSGLGLFLGDYYTRPTKSGGAWMNSFVHQSRLLENRPVVINNLNISRPADGEPTLLTLAEVTTAFHEFGHALHGLFSAVEYPSLSGTAVPRDFVEYPSQVNEMWMLWPEVVQNYAKHHITGEVLPQEVIDRIEAASTWGEGFATTEYLGAALLDLAWHELEPGQSVEDPLDFERDALEKAGVLVSLIPPRYRTGYFKHIFAGGYAAGYYSYIWSEVLDADTVEWFKSNGGATRANGERFRELLLSRGNSQDPLESFRQFRGRDAEMQPLLVRRGLA